jgi:hypothetical protein
MAMQQWKWSRRHFRIKSKIYFLVMVFVFTVSLHSNGQQFFKRIIPDPDYFVLCPNLTFKNPSGPGFYAYGNNYYDAQTYNNVLPVFMLLHFDDAGEIVWQKGFVSEFYPVGIFRDASSGNLILIGKGSSNGAVVLYCLNASGDIINIKHLSFPAIAQPDVIDAVETSDGTIGVLIDVWDGIIMKINLNGDVLWYKKLVNMHDDYKSFSLTADANGNLFALMSDDFHDKSYVLGLNASGNIIQEIVFSDVFNLLIFDGISGYYGIRSNSDFKIIRLDAQFNPVWMKRQFLGMDFLNAQASGTPGEITLSFTRQIFHFDSLGNVYDVVAQGSNWYSIGMDHQIINSIGKPNDPAMDTVIACYGNFNFQNMNTCVFSPSVVSFSSDVLPVKWGDTVSFYPLAINEVVGSYMQVIPQNAAADYCPTYTDIPEVIQDKIHVYPLPADDVLHISFEIANGECKVLECFNLHGELLFSEKVSTGNVDFSTSSFPSGVYFLRLGLFTQKIVVQH